MADSPPPLTIYLSLTSSPSTPRSTLTIPSPTSTFTAAQLRKEAAKITTVPLDKLKLIFRGRVISISNKDVGNNINVVEEYKLENECVVHVMGKPVAGSGVSATSGAATSTASAATSATAAGARVTLPSSSTTANAAATASSSGSATTPIAAALDKLRSSNDGPTYRTALTTADKLLGNVVAHPMEEKYRTIKKSNPAFTKRLGGLPGGNDLMLASGFTIETRDADSIEYYVLTPSAHAWPALVASREEIGRVLSESNRSTASAVHPMGGAGMPGAHSMPGMGGMPNFMPPGATNAASGGFGGSGGAGGGGMPDMAAVQNMLSDPTMMQNVMGMMNNPMVQNMMQNDPRFANNPMLQQSLQALQSNPEMMNQMASMMSDPAARERMASMMGGMGGNSGTAGGGAGAADAFAGGPDAMRRQMEQFQQMSQQFGGSSGGFNTGGAGGGSSGTAAPAGGGTNNNASSSNAGGNDSDMTEEEMIAEAIRRSMEQS